MLHFKSQVENQNHLYLTSQGRDFTLHYISYLVGVLCKSVGVLLAEVRAGGAGALSRGPAEGVAATSLTGADRGLLSGGDPTWLPVREPAWPEDRQIKFRSR